MHYISLNLVDVSITNLETLVIHELFWQPCCGLNISPLVAEVILYSAPSHEYSTNACSASSLIR